MKEKYLKDIAEIKDIMNRSSKFISLSGLSGVAAGSCALIGAYFAYQKVYSKPYIELSETFVVGINGIFDLLSIAFLTLVAAILSGLFFTRLHAKKQQQKLWDDRSKRLLINLAIPLLTGGLVCLKFLFDGNNGYLAPLTLVFYGLALVNASKYTLNEIRSLGIIEIILGIVALNYIGYGLWFWVIGFGILHIIYGIYMHLKYK